MNCKTWLRTNGHWAVANKIERSEKKWKRQGKLTRRNWWAVLAGKPDGRPNVIDGVVFPIIPFARERQYGKKEKAQKKFNGEPMSHWQAMADRLVVENLLDASGRLDERSIVGKLAFKRLSEIAVAENPKLVKELLADRGIVLKNMARALNDMTRRKGM